jgi:hypothetical protein
VGAKKYVFLLIVCQWANCGVYGRAGRDCAYLQNPRSHLVMQRDTIESLTCKEFERAMHSQLYEPIKFRAIDGSDTSHRSTGFASGLIGIPLKITG